MKWNRKREDKKTESVSIKSYAPSETLIAQDYVIPDFWDEFEREFEKECRSWIEKKKVEQPDEFSFEYMDLVTDLTVKYAISKIIEQKCDHRHVIGKLMDCFSAERKIAEKKEEYAKNDLEEIEKELADLRNIHMKAGKEAHEDEKK